MTRSGHSRIELRRFSNRQYFVSRKSGPTIGAPRVIYCFRGHFTALPPAPQGQAC